MRWLVHWHNYSTKIKKLIQFMQQFSIFFKILGFSVLLFSIGTPEAFGQKTEKPASEGLIFMQNDDPERRANQWYPFIQNQRIEICNKHLEFIEAQYGNDLVRSSKILNDTILNLAYQTQASNEQKWIDFEANIPESQKGKETLAIRRSLRKWKLEIQALEIDHTKREKNPSLSLNSWTMKKTALKQRLNVINFESLEFQNGRPIVDDPNQKIQNQEIDLSASSKNPAPKTTKQVNSEFRFYAQSTENLSNRLNGEALTPSDLRTIRDRLQQFNGRLKDRKLEEPDLSFVKNLKQRINSELETIYSLEALIAENPSSYSLYLGPEISNNPDQTSLSSIGKLLDNTSDSITIYHHKDWEKPNWLKQGFEGSSVDFKKHKSLPADAILISFPKK